MEVAVFIVLLNANHMATPSVENITTAIAAETTPSPRSSVLEKAFDKSLDNVANEKSISEFIFTFYLRISVSEGKGFSQ